jgi:uncharacterized protein (UPF0333 family)
MIKMLAELLKILNSATYPSQISLAFSLSMLGGLLLY